MGAVLDNIYNNYLTTYTPKNVTRYDTHKKSELRSVYNSIVKLNKESPWYLPVTNKDTQHTAVAIKEQTRRLHNSLAQMGALDEDGLFQKKSAYSSQPDAVTATYIGGSQTGTNQNRKLGLPEQTGMDASKLEVEIKSLASPQENMGVFLPNARISIPADTYSFDVSINDMNYEFQFSIESNETNHEVLSRLSRLMNNADIGISASVLLDGDKSAIKMVSNTTGLSADKENIFQISDSSTSKRSGTVDYFGLDYITKKASNAVFTINGEEGTAPENRIITSDYDLQLHGTTALGHAAKVGLKTDIESLSDNISHLAESFNEFSATVSELHDSQTKSNKLLAEMRGIAGLYKSSLESLGVQITEDGRLSVDHALVHQAADASDDIKETFKPIRSFARALLKKSDQISLNPMEYVDRTVVAYKNPGHNFSSPYTTSLYSGMMYNFRC